LVVQMFGTPGVKTQVAAVPKPTEKVAVKEVLGDEEIVVEENMAVVEDMVSPMTFRESVLMTPLQLTKAFFLAVIVLVVMTLIYDTFVSGSKKTAHIVNKNIGHLMVFGAVAFMLIFFKGGMVN